MKYSRTEKFSNQNKKNNEKQKKKKIRLKKSIKFLIIIIFILFITFSFTLYYGKNVTVNKFEINEYNVPSLSITDNFHGLKIIHISDINYNGKNIEFIKKIVTKINLTKPDIVIFSGDLLDTNSIIEANSLDELTSTLKDITSVYGKYAVKGDNDYISSFDIIMENSDFLILNNTYDIIYGENIEKIIISGISSHIKDKKKIDEKLQDIYKYINNSEVIYSILIMHEPDAIDKFNCEKFNLVLSGHTLGGEVNIPFIGGINYPEYGNKYTDKYYNFGSTDFYISNGVGTSKLKMRLFNTPTANLYRILKED